LRWCGVAQKAATPAVAFPASLAQEVRQLDITQRARRVHADKNYDDIDDDDDDDDDDDVEWMVMMMMMVMLMRM
jgi:hypothetical protein